MSEEDIPSPITPKRRRNKHKKETPETPIIPAILIPEPTPSIRRESSFMSDGRVAKIDNGFTIKRSFPSEDEDELMFNELLGKITELSHSTQTRAKKYRFLTDLATLFIIISGIAVGVGSFNGFEGRPMQYMQVILGFVVAAVQTTLTTFQFQKKGALLKDASVRLSKKEREIRLLMRTPMPPIEKYRKYNELCDRIDDIDQALYNGLLIPTDDKSKSRYRQSDSDSLKLPQPSSPQIKIVSLSEDTKDISIPDV